MSIIDTVLENNVKNGDKTEARIQLSQLNMSLTQSIGYFKDLAEPTQEALLDMAYSMGFSKLLGFRKMWASLAERDYLWAALEILDSEYHRNSVLWASGDIENTRSFENAEKVRRSTKTYGQET
jgi:hypothetical protein